MTSNQLAENSVIQLLNSVKLARDNAERADNRVDHSFYYALTIALEELQERRKADKDPYGFTDGDRRGMIYKPEHACRLSDPVPVYLHAQPAPVVPDGYVMVPKEPTSEMVKKMRYHVGSYDRNIKDGYKAMLAAAPQEVKK